MDFQLLKLVAFLRPIFCIDIGGTGGHFDLAAIGMFGILTIVFLSHSALKKSILFSGIDLLIFSFVLWCVAIYLIYMEAASFRELAKLLIPLLTYVIVKNVIRNESQYQNLILVMLAGFVLPILISSGMIMVGKGIESTNYWTGAIRHKGAYAGGHSLAHNITFFCFAATTYASMVKIERGNLFSHTDFFAKTFIIVLVALAVYCLVMSRTRTPMLGLLVFGFVVLLNFNRRLLFVGITTAVLVGFFLWPVLLPYLFSDVVMIERGHGDIDQIGSGRPDIWAGNISRFLALPLDMQIAGSGVGSNKGGDRISELGFRDSHNDFLDILVQTGFVGLFLYTMLQLAFLNAIIRIPSKVKYVFIATWAAVNIMNLVSNSYVSRFGLAQMYYILLSYIELPRPVGEALNPVPGKSRKIDE